MRVKYTAALSDISGYGSAARGYIHALEAAGLEVYCNPISFEPWKPAEVVKKLLGPRISRRIHNIKGEDAHIVHLTPDLFKGKKSRSFTAGYYAWEASELPKHWPGAINTLDEGWVPSSYNKEVSLISGVKKGIFILPHVITIPDLNKETTESLALKGLPEDIFKFYSVFQWNTRKNPEGLLSAYLQEFSRDEKVSLVLKTYFNSDSDQDRSYIRRSILRIKENCGNKNPPQILLIEKILTPKELDELHRRCDCYVSMSRGEGFGLPPFEGLAYGNPIIVPNHTAFKDFLDITRAFLIESDTEVPIQGMPSIYTADMKWKDPSIASCRRLLRYVFENRRQSMEIGENGRRWVIDNLSEKVIGKKIRERLEKAV